MGVMRWIGLPLALIGMFIVWYFIAWRNWRSSTNIWHAMEPTGGLDVGGDVARTGSWRRWACGREKPSWGQVDTRQQGKLGWLRTMKKGNPRQTRQT